MIAYIIRMWFRRAFTTPTSSRKPKSFCPRLERLETRDCPAVFNPVDAASLIAAINTANANNQPDTINLVQGGLYVFTSGIADPPGTGLSGLPNIGQDSGSAANTITINANGATLFRDAASPQFRIINISGGTLILNNATIWGGLSNAGLFGGGIRLEDPTNLTGPQANLILHDSLIYRNGSTSSGGGIDLSNGAKAVIIDSTIAQNTAAVNGGGIEVIGTNAVAILVNDTITQNTAQFFTVGGGGISAEDGTTTIVNTIVAGNMQGPNPITAVPDDLRRGTAFVAVVNVQNSLIQETPPPLTINGNNFNNIFGLNPNLGALKYNGGVTATQALQANSAAIDRGDSSLTVGETSDQRGPGFNRIINGRIDIGAYEFQQRAVSIGLVSSVNPSMLGQTVIFTAVVQGLAANSNIPQGTATFVIDNAIVATVALNGGVASIGVSTLSAGGHAVQVLYNPASPIGDYGFDAGRSGILTQTVLPPAGPRSPFGRRWRR